MATRRTRLKGRRTPQKTEEKQVKKGASRVQTKRKNVATPTGQLKTGKGVPKKSVKVVSKPKQKTPAKRTKKKTANGTNTRATPKAGYESDGKKANGTSARKSSKDEYEFDETDDFISGESFLSASFSAIASEKTPRNSIFTSIKRKKGNVANTQKPEKNQRKKLFSRSARQKEDKKKTSTPLTMSEVANCASKRQPGNSQGKHRYLLVSLPKLDFDMSVTPILPISTDSPLSPSPRQKVRKGSEAKSVSFGEDVKLSIPDQTPSLPLDKVNHQKAQRQAVETRHTSRSSPPAGFKKPAPVLPAASSTSAAVPRQTNRKRKSPEPSSSAELGRTEGNNTPAKRKKTEVPKTKQSLLNSKVERLSQKVSISPKKKSTKKQAPKQTKLPCSTEIRKSPRQNKLVTSTPLLPPGVQKTAKDSTPVLYDSGISMEDDLNTSGEGNSAATTPSLPGFMEDEPLQSPFQALSESPLSAPNNTSSEKEDSTAYKSAAKEYKPGKMRREKGRFSTSRMDEWASAVNQSLQDIESFELVVE